MSQGARETHQKRSRETRDKLLSALEKLLREKDFADIGVGEIAALAGVSPASVYRRFDKKQGFIPVLFELYLERLSDWAGNPEAQVNLEGCDLRTALAQVANGAWRQLQQQSHLMRAIFLHGRAHLALLGEKGDEYEDMMLQAMRSVLELYKKDIKRTDLDKAARMLAYYLNNIFLERGLFKGQTGTWTDTLPDAQFVREAADFAYGYLMTEEPG